MNECKCGAPIVSAQVRVVTRCQKGHLGSSDVSPTSIGVEKVHEPVTDGQLRAFNGKAGALDKLNKAEPGTAKKLALAEVGVTSTKDLNAGQLSGVLDRMEEQLEQLRATAR